MRVSRRSASPNALSRICTFGLAAGLQVGCGAEADGTALPIQAPVEDASSRSDATADGPGIDAAACVPRTCAQAGAECGSIPDGCGSKTDCGTCASGEQCGGGGANRCGSSGCAPRSCAQASASCGYVSDNCSEAIFCGGCNAPASCGAAGVANQCGCIPKSCVQLGAACGTAPDGCGGVVNCGDCPSGQTCGGGGPNLCGNGACTPRSCAQLGASCGVISDACSQAVDCGDCAAGQQCGAGGVANECECVCQRDHALTQCHAGVCAITSCDPGYADCDANEANGCETPLATDPANCGSCATNCDASQCTSAGCVAGKCTQQPLPDATACGTCHVCSSGNCVNAPNNTQCGTNVCHYCESGSCAQRATGYQYDGTKSHRCCGGNPVDISSDHANCGGCGLGCASGHSCESVSSTSDCSSHPSKVSGRCTCSSGDQCPKGTNKSYQTCRTATPDDGRCAPADASYCASGEAYQDISSCPNYCYYK